MATILVVEDDATVVELLKMALEMDGHKVEVAEDGASAMEKLGVKYTVMEPLRPDLIVLDIMMPRVDGYTLLIELLRNPATINIPVIVLTAKSQMKDTMIYEKNVAAFITKPFDISVLMEKVRKVLKR